MLISSAASVACILCCPVIFEARLECPPVPLFLFIVIIGAVTVIISDGLPSSLILSALISLLEGLKHIESTTRPRDMLVGERSSFVEVETMNPIA